MLTPTLTLTLTPTLTLSLPLTLTLTKVLGCLAMIDDGETDWKVIPLTLPLPLPFTSSMGVWKLCVVASAAALSAGFSSLIQPG